MKLETYRRVENLIKRKRKIASKELRKIVNHESLRRILEQMEREKKIKRDNEKIPVTIHLNQEIIVWRGGK